MIVCVLERSDSVYVRMRREREREFVCQIERGDRVCVRERSVCERRKKREVCVCEKG